MAVKRIVGAVVLLAALGATSATDSVGALAFSPSQAQEALIEFGLDRFENQGLVLPDVRIEFFGSLDCQGHKGLYLHKTQTVRMCSLDKKTLLHELAHAWARYNLTPIEMEGFARYRELEAWNNPADPWKERAAEHAAEVIAWALMDRPVHVRLTVLSDPCQSSEFRLLTIEDSTVEKLHEAFLMLTGLEPIFRAPSEWDSKFLEMEWTAKVADTTSPEARRVSANETFGQPQSTDPCT